LNARVVRLRTSSIIARAPAASVAPTPIDPKAPASDTAAANEGVATPAIGAWIKGTESSNRLMRDIPTGPNR
jgi:hypothetical protein